MHRMNCASLLYFALPAIARFARAIIMILDDEFEWMQNALMGSSSNGTKFRVEPRLTCQIELSEGSRRLLFP